MFLLFTGNLVSAGKLLLPAIRSFVFAVLRGYEVAGLPADTIFF